MKPGADNRDFAPESSRTNASRWVCAGEPRRSRASGGGAGGRSILSRPGIEPRPPISIKFHDANLFGLLPVRCEHLFFRKIRARGVHSYYPALPTRRMFASERVGGLKFSVRLTRKGAGIFAFSATSRETLQESLKLAYDAPRKR